MLLYSTIWKSFFWMAMGILYAIMIAGAPSLADNLGLQMSWWKWILVALWYVLVTINLAAGFTLIGEKERGAGPKFMAASLIPLAILGVCLWFLIQ